MKTITLTENQYNQLKGMYFILNDVVGDLKNLSALAWLCRYGLPWDEDPKMFSDEMKASFLSLNTLRDKVDKTKKDVENVCDWFNQFTTNIVLTEEKKRGESNE